MDQRPGTRFGIGRAVRAAIPWVNLWRSRTAYSKFFDALSGLLPGRG
jgi:hypothetical protein